MSKLKYTGNLDGIDFNRIITDNTGFDAKKANKRPWGDTSVQAVDIDWNAAQVQSKVWDEATKTFVTGESKTINSTGNLLEYIQTGTVTNFDKLWNNVKTIQDSVAEKLEGLKEEELTDAQKADLRKLRDTLIRSYGENDKEINALLTEIDNLLDGKTGDIGLVYNLINALTNKTNSAYITNKINEILESMSGDGDNSLTPEQIATINNNVKPLIESYVATLDSVDSELGTKIAQLFDLLKGSDGTVGGAINELKDDIDLAKTYNASQDWVNTQINNAKAALEGKDLTEAEKNQVLTLVNSLIQKGYNGDTIAGLIDQVNTFDNALDELKDDIATAELTQASKEWIEGAVQDALNDLNGKVLTEDDKNELKALIEQLENIGVDPALLDLLRSLLTKTNKITPTTQIKIGNKNQNTVSTISNITVERPIIGVDLLQTQSADLTKYHVRKINYNYGNPENVVVNISYNGTPVSGKWDLTRDGLAYTQSAGTTSSATTTIEGSQLSVPSIYTLTFTPDKSTLKSTVKTTVKPTNEPSSGTTEAPSDLNIEFDVEFETLQILLNVVNQDSSQAEIIYRQANGDEIPFGEASTADVPARGGDAHWTIDGKGEGKADTPTVVKIEPEITFTANYPNNKIVTSTSSNVIVKTDVKEFTLYSSVNDVNTGTVVYAHAGDFKFGDIATKVGFASSYNGDNIYGSWSVKRANENWNVLNYNGESNTALTQSYYCGIAPSTLVDNNNSLEVTFTPDDTAYSTRTITLTTVSEEIDFSKLTFAAVEGSADIEIFNPYSDNRPTSMNGVRCKEEGTVKVTANYTNKYGQQINTRTVEIEVHDKIEIEDIILPEVVEIKPNIVAKSLYNKQFVAQTNGIKNSISLIRSITDFDLVGNDINNLNKSDELSPDTNDYSLTIAKETNHFSSKVELVKTRTIYAEQPLLFTAVSAKYNELTGAGSEIEGTFEFFINGKEFTEKPLHVGGGAYDETGKLLPVLSPYTLSNNDVIHVVFTPKSDVVTLTTQEPSGSDSPSASTTATPSNITYKLVPVEFDVYVIDEEIDYTKFEVVVKKGEDIVDKTVYTPTRDNNGKHSGYDNDKLSVNIIPETICNVDDNGNISMNRYYDTNSLVRRLYNKNDSTESVRYNVTLQYNGNYNSKHNHADDSKYPQVINLNITCLGTGTDTPSNENGEGPTSKPSATAGA